MEITTEAGFGNTNMPSMMKAGKARIDVERVPALAKALECDPKPLFSMVIGRLGVAPDFQIDNDGSADTSRSQHHGSSQKTFASLS